MDRYTLIPSFSELIIQLLRRGNFFVIYHDNEHKAIADTIMATLREKGYATKIISQSNQVDDIPTPVDYYVACLITTPQSTLDLVKKLTAVKINNIWLEPGSESTETINFGKEHKINLVYYHSLVKEIINS